MKNIVDETINQLVNENKKNLTEMARIGFTDDGFEVYINTDDGFEVYINTDDGGNIPHFHYRTKNTWEFHTCIRLDIAEYFHHDGKEDILNSKQRKQLVKFLKQNLEIKDIRLIGKEY